MNKRRHVPASFAAQVIRELKSEGADPALSLKVQSLFAKLNRTAAGRQTANIQSAVPLTTYEKRAIEKNISSIVGSAITAEYAVNPDLLTGFRVSVGELLVDASGFRLLSDMSSALTA